MIENNTIDELKTHNYFKIWRLNIKVFKNIFSLSYDLNNHKRIEILDFARGFVMLLVLMHHSGMPGKMWIIAFHMPFFFILSGYTESLRNNSVNNINYLTLIKSRFKRLMVPYFSFELLNFLIYCVWKILSHKSFYPISYLIRIVLCLNDSSDNGEFLRLWFLPCLFVSDVFFYLILRFIKQKPSLLVTSGALFIISYLMTKFFDFRLPFTLDIAIISTAFIILGYVGNSLISYFLIEKHIVTDLFCFAITALTLVYIYFNSNAHIYMYDNDYGEYIFSFLGALAGSFACIIFIKYFYLFAKRITIVKKLILWYGLNSLACFPVHLEVNWFIGVAWELVCHLISLKYNVLPWYLILLSMIFFTIPAVNFITKYLPFMLGKAFQKRKTS